MVPPKNRFRKKMRKELKRDGWCMSVANTKEKKFVRWTISWLAPPPLKKKDKNCSAITVGVNAILIKKLEQFVTLGNILTKSWMWDSLSLVHTGRTSSAIYCILFRQTKHFTHQWLQTMLHTYTHFTHQWLQTMEFPDSYDQCEPGIRTGLDAVLFMSRTY